MKVTVRYFASIREALGRSQEQVDTEASTLAGLRQALIARGAPYADVLSADRAVRLALDQQIADATTALHDGCEVAFFPPVTGG